MTEDEYKEHEALNKTLLDPQLRAEYAAAYDHYRPGLTARVLGRIFVGFGDLVYGKRPSYEKFKAIEVVARIPYQSWEVASFTLLTALYSDEQKAIELSRTSTFSRMALDNETLHVVVMSQLVRKYGRAGVFRHTLIPIAFSLFYFWAIFFLYLVSRRSSLELNYLFEAHALAQYQEFLDTHEEHLRNAHIHSAFLEFYGRYPRCEYEFFESVRNDELIHRNRSIRELEAHTDSARS